ncbi:hypothetical protein [Pararhodobacter zhoushanensis]|uniref:Uncharacterized protein n=1 Tax=Pararhodobacter zhoushanensis TaxID=2479545 RepID=A0ABT3H144_9RHOB|nr:hypothetical protein [Pararhodobacter zhoushanensis]MCW1933504.1 hypothetical protein [Pararhodobacter zhoushanensis]
MEKTSVASEAATTPAAKTRMMARAVPLSSASVSVPIGAASESSRAVPDPAPSGV